MHNTLKQRYEQLRPFLNELQGRLFVADEAIAYRRGGIAFVEQELPAGFLKPYIQPLE